MANNVNYGGSIDHASEDDIYKIFAQLTLHEFLLEISHANIFKDLPNPVEQFDEFAQTIKMRIYEPPLQPGLNPRSAEKVQLEAVRLTENFLNRTRQRLLLILQQMEETE